MRRLLVAMGVVVAATLGLAGVAGAEPIHFQAGQQWTLEFVTGPGQDGACTIETVGPNNTLTFDAIGLPNGGIYGGGRKYLRESFASPLSTYRFHGSWSNSEDRYTGRLTVKGAFEPGSFPGQVVPGAIAHWGNATC